MIKRKLKTCKRCHRDKVIFGKGLCTTCYKIVNSKKYKPKKSKPKKVSAKLSGIMNDYRKVRAQYLKDHPCCEVRLPGCSECDDRLMTIHHKKGRIGELLLDTNYFLACCLTCHEFIEKNPEWAKENNFSESRLNKEQN